MRRTKRSNARQNAWTEEDVARLAINPIYGVRISPNLLKTAPKITVPEAEWVALNADACRAVGAKVYLENLTAILSEDFAPSETPGGDFFDPRCAIKVAEAFIIPVSARLIPTDQWISANVRLMEDLGTERWLALFLDVLRGGYV